MRKLIPLLLVALLVAFTLPALAGDGNLEWTASKTITLAEDFDYSETVTFFGKGIFVFDGEAWAKIQEQQELYTNTLNEYGQARSASIAGSFSEGATGIANMNQSPGNLNNQGNEVAISVASSGAQTLPPTPAPGEAVFVGMFAEAQAVSAQYIGVLATKVTVDGDGGETAIMRTGAPNTLTTQIENKSTSITNSFNDFSGVFNVNQGAGSLNNQGNAVAIAAGIDQVVVKAASHVMLAQVTAANQLNDNGINYTDSIIGSGNGAHGVGNVNQASGSMNNQKNMVTLGFSHP